MTDTFDTNIDVLSLHKVVVNGTVDDPANVASVEVFRGDKDVGSAHVSANGTWHLAIAPSKPNAVEVLTAVITDGFGNETTVNSTFGVSANSPTTGEVFQQIANPNSLDGHVFTSDGQLLYDQFVTSTNNGQKISAVETGHGANVPFFVFTLDANGAHTTQDITNFHVAKASHDTLDFSSTSLTNIAQVLHHTSTFHGTATIHLDQNNFVVLEGVTKSQLAQHRNVFFFG